MLWHKTQTTNLTSTKAMHSLIDGDILVYRTGYTVNEEGQEGLARARMNDTIQRILDTTNARDFTIYLSDSKNNFRLNLFKDYKANRKQPKPIHLEYLQNVLLKDWKAEVAFDEEADDALGINQKQDHSTCICTIDKDLLQVPGLHYNWVTGKSRSIGDVEANSRFYAQILTGDSTDNVSIATGLSCPGIGPVKAEALLEGCNTEEEMFQAVCNAYYKALYKDISPGQIQERILLTGQLLKIRRKVGEIWVFPCEPQWPS